jgi:hypothetical protein
MPGDIQKITTHVANAIEKLLAQYKGKPNYETLITIIGEEVQELENVFYSLIFDRFLATATDEVLNQIGKMVNEPRPVSGLAATDDDIYRALIYARIAINTSYGTIPDVINLLRILGADKVILRNAFPAGFRVEMTGDMILTLTQIITALESATAPVEIVASIYTSHPFGFDDDPEAYGFDDGELAE